MAQEELRRFGFLQVGENVKISTRAAIYHAERIALGDGCRVDDFCILSGSVNIGKHVHIAAHSLVDGGDEGIEFHDYAVLAYGCYAFAVSDDYSGESLTSLTVPEKYKTNLIRGKIVFGRYSIAGTGTIIFPGASLGEGSAVGAGSIVTRPTEPWSMYRGRPAKKTKDRSKNMLHLASRLAEDQQQ
ncbi:acyltransferase [Variovorax sp. PBS-H4]|uniref:acyltransferase n=1 Tax=Variovorax sp. PBS-H4 TaxID=434008 RepID=UPI0018D93184|nr:acyltransferase [Variovorax sp. PBS-H4]